ncbi:SDR family oxidoreductase [Adhaeribacter soli]|uniref:SDR family oxidoreductase n=1 Tax=Adhaeribacter soli TaxID=2607655 RepID=A0A5N1J5U3_9BACT|nr:SDR family oxidoreductase [Adhaeribacter soli]KAA9346087.1 SDR family oxidoreductase [Adhaeribacter soli]
MLTELNNPIFKPLTDKIALVTGASSGIGKITARELAHLGAHVVMVCRNAEKAAETRKEIIAQTGNENITLLVADLALMQEVKRCAAEFSARFPKLDILVNNVGMMPGKRTLTAEGFEISWATNHLAPFLLTNLVIDKMVAAESARIVNVSSEAHRLGDICFQDMNSPKKYNAFTAYCDSKLANIMFTYELSRRLEFTNITANVLHPGMVATKFGHEHTGSLKYLFLLARPFMISPEQGARTSLYLAASPEVEDLSGYYFSKMKPIKSAEITYNPNISHRLWTLSEIQTGFQF